MRNKREKKSMLQEIAGEIERCRICKKDGTGKAVPGEGNPDAAVVFIGEAPGREESTTGRPFVGRSGMFLRSMIRLLGLREEDVFLTSPVHYLPLRDVPSMETIDHGCSHLNKQLAIISPRLVVLLGNTACRALLGKNVKLEQEHGTFLSGDRFSFYLTFHPAYAMRFPAGKEKFLRDFQKLRKLIEDL